MQLTILDPNVSNTMNGFLVIANTINLIYNIPQMMRTYQTKSTKDFSAWFIFLRIVGNTIWIVYALEVESLQMLINYSVTVLASIFISYYKCIELYDEYQYKRITLVDDEEHMLGEHMVGEHMLDEPMLGEPMLGEHMLDEPTINSDNIV